MRKYSLLLAALALSLLATGSAPISVIAPDGVGEAWEMRDKEYCWLFTVGQDTSAIVDAALYAATAGATIDSVVNLEGVWAWDEVRTILNYSLEPADSGVTTLYRYDDYTQIASGISWQGMTDRHRPLKSQTNLYTLVYMPIEDYIPANATISRARLVLNNGNLVSSSGNASPGDSVYAVLDTLVADRYWITGPNTGSTTLKFPGKRAASWNNQIQPIHTDDSTNVNRRAGYKFSSALTDSYAWNPTLKNRKMTIDWGPRGQGVRQYWNSGAGDTSLSVSLDMDRVVQYQVNGAQNSGYWIMHSDASTNRTAYVRFYYGAAKNYRSPFMVVKWKAKPHRWPWPGNKEVAFSLVMDDAIKDVNDTLSYIFNQRGLSYTIGAIGNASLTDYDSAGTRKTATPTGLLRYFERGMEIVSHSRVHNPAYTGSDPKRGIANITYDVSDDGDVGGDSLAWAMEPGWIDSALAAASGVNDSAYYAAHPRTGRVFVFPHNQYSLKSLLVADSLGYVGCRGPALGGRPSIPTPGDTVGDQMDGTAANSWTRSFGIRTPRKMNLMVVPYGPYTSTTPGISTIFGKEGAAITDSTNIKRSIAGWLEWYATMKHNGYWIAFAHSMPNPGHGYTNEAIAPYHARWMLNQFDASGNVWVANMGDVMTFWRRNANFEDHPDDRGGADEWDDLIAGDRKMWATSRRMP